MDVMRQLERRLEAALDRAAGRFFRSAPHLSEVVGAIVRVLDLSVDPDSRVPNLIVLPAGRHTLSDADRAAIAEATTEAVLERGWRLDGPVRVEAGAGRTLAATVDPGPLPVWARLVGAGGELEVRHNRAVLGRGSGADVAIDHPSVSRRHAMLWRQEDRVLVADLSSANGTTVDGRPIGAGPVPVDTGRRLGFGAASFKLVLDA